MAHRKTPSVNQNWIKTDTVDENKKQAAVLLERCKKQEAEKKVKYVLVSTTPKTYKRIIVNN